MQYTVRGGRPPSGKSSSSRRTGSVSSGKISIYASSEQPRSQTPDRVCRCSSVRKPRISPFREYRVSREMAEQDRDTFSRVQKLCDENKGEEAFREIERLYQRHPSNIYIRYYYGVCAAAKGDYSLGLEHLNPQKLKNDQYNLNALFLRAWCYCSVGKKQKGQEYFLYCIEGTLARTKKNAIPVCFKVIREITKLNPKIAWNALVTLHKKRRDELIILEDYYILSGDLYYLLGKYKYAERAYCNKRVKRKDYLIEFKRGRAKWAHGKRTTETQKAYYENIKEHFSNSLNLNSPGKAQDKVVYGQCYYYLNLVYIKLNDQVLAATCFALYNKYVNEHPEVQVKK